jgi:Phosphoesterase family
MTSTPSRPSRSRLIPSRRSVLKGGLAAAALAGTGAWRFAPGHPFGHLRQPDSLPYPRRPAGTDTIPQIEHIVVLTYDGFHRYGFRVPCAVVSPWARRDYVSHQVKDHTSICALIEAKWNLPAMTLRDANANPMPDMIDLRHPAFRTPPRLAQPLLATDPGAMACSTSGPGTIPPPGSVSPGP